MRQSKAWQIPPMESRLSIPLQELQAQPNEQTRSNHHSHREIMDSTCRVRVTYPATSALEEAHGAVEAIRSQTASAIHHPNTTKGLRRSATKLPPILDNLPSHTPQVTHLCRMAMHFQSSPQDHSIVADRAQGTTAHKAVLGTKQEALIRELGSHMILPLYIPTTIINSTHTAIRTTC